jgi:hypothetical protein
MDTLGVAGHGSEAQPLAPPHVVDASLVLRATITGVETAMMLAADSIIPVLVSAMRNACHRIETEQGGMLPCHRSPPCMWRRI